MGVSSIILYYAPVCHRMTLSALNLARPLAVFYFRERGSAIWRH